MPELPEVETIKSGLKKAIVGKTIAGVDVRVPKLFHGDKKEIIGKKIKNIDRRAKQIIIDIEGSNDLLIHLKMTGQLIYRENRDNRIQNAIRNQTAGGHPSKDWFDKLPNLTTHIIFDFSDGSKLFFNDLRKFGWIKIFDSKKLREKLSEELGVEPFDRDFTVQKLSGIIKSKPRWNIKKVLTDQSLIAGIGNIYADESLFWAKIQPERKADSLTDKEIKTLHSSIIKSLEIGLRWGGTSDNSYLNVEGKKGRGQEHLQVYGREGKNCHCCGGKIKKIKLNGRGTHFCSECQK